MPGFLDPLWFIALAAIPFIRWLHRWQVAASHWPVSALFLWDHANQVDAPGRTKKPPDPAWRRRALAIALLITALANPYWRSEVRSLTVWVDDSLSMFVLENDRTRLAMVMESLSHELNRSESRWAEIQLRSLTNPGQVQLYSSAFTANSDAWQSGQPAEPNGPPASVMSDESSHWLLTDGASESVRMWAQRVNIDRLIQSGVTTENSAVTLLAARRSLELVDGLDILVSISNTGVDTDVRQLELYDGRQLLQTTDLTLLPGQTIHRQTRVSATGQSLTASLAPGDFLSRDDSLTISRDKFQPLAALVDDDCPTALRRALAAHPALQLSDESSDPALHVSCPRERFPDLSNLARTSAGAQIRALVTATQPVSATPTWLPYAGFRQDFMLSAEWVSAAQWPGSLADIGPGIVLSAGETPLVVVHKQDAGASANAVVSTIVDTVVDMDQSQFIRQPEFAAFVATLTDIATQRHLLDETISVSRDVQASIVTPVRIDTNSSRSAAGQQVIVTPLSTLFALAALLIIALDAALVLGASRGAIHA
jgi:hypothetical protein